MPLSAHEDRLAGCTPYPRTAKYMFEPPIGGINVCCFGFYGQDSDDLPGFVYLFVCFTSQVNSYNGHCGTVSSPNHTFSWVGLNKRLTSTSCTHFRL